MFFCCWAAPTSAYVNKVVFLPLSTYAYAGGHFGAQIRTNIFIYVHTKYTILSDLKLKTR
jgi:hypothetical protein